MEPDVITCDGNCSGTGRVRGGSYAILVNGDGIMWMAAAELVVICSLCTGLQLSETKGSPPPELLVG